MSKYPYCQHATDPVLNYTKHRVSLLLSGIFTAESMVPDHEDIIT